MKKKTLFISDLDGTLLDSNVSLPSEYADKLNRLTRDGVMITYATARTIRSVSHILRDIDFSLDSCPPIALMNGVLIRDMKSGEYVSSAVIDRVTAASIISAFEKIGAEPFVYTIDKSNTIDGDPLHTYYREIKGTPMRKFLDERVVRYKKPFIAVPSLHEIESEDIIYFCVLGDELLVRHSYDALDGLGGIKYAFYRDSYDIDTWYLEVFSEYASKAHAVEFLRQYTGADEVVCFGDNLNDLPMFEKSDVRVAVEGAVDEVKKAADSITSSVPDFIEEYVRKNST